MPRAKLDQVLNVLGSPDARMTDVVVLAGLPRRRKGCDWRFFASLSNSQFLSLTGYGSLDSWLDHIDRLLRAVCGLRQVEHKERARNATQLRDAERELHSVRCVLDSWARSQGLPLSDGIAYIKPDAPRVRFVS